MGITIPEGEGRRRRSRDEDEDEEEVDPADPRGKKPSGTKRKKKLKQIAWHLIDGSGNMIPILLTEAEAKAQLRVTLERSIVEKCTP